MDNGEFLDNMGFPGAMIDYRTTRRLLLVLASQVAETIRKSTVSILEYPPVIAVWGDYRTRGNIDIKKTLTNLTKQTFRQYFFVKFAYKAPLSFSRTKSTWF